MKKKIKILISEKSIKKLLPGTKYLLNLDRKFHNCQVDSRIWQCVNSGKRDGRFPVRGCKRGFLFHVLGNISNKQDIHKHSYEIAIH